MRSILGQIIGTNKLEPISQVMDPDHALQLPVAALVAILRHQNKVVAPEEEGSWEQSRGIQRLQIETVLKRGILTFRPFPDEDIIELMSDSVLDGNKVTFIPVPTNILDLKY